MTRRSEVVLAVAIWTRSDLTFSGKVSLVYYALRRHVVPPAHESRRCIMGFPVGDGEEVRCPRHAVTPGALWCKRHLPSNPEVPR